MVITCAASFCSNKSGKTESVSFFRFPKIVEERNQWASLIGRNDLLNRDVKSQRVCSEHFDATCFTSSSEGRQKVSLISEAMPKKKKQKDAVFDPETFDDKTETSEGQVSMIELVTDVCDEESFNNVDIPTDVSQMAIESCSTLLSLRCQSQFSNSKLSLASTSSSYSVTSTQTSLQLSSDTPRKLKLGKSMKYKDDQYNDLLRQFTELQQSVNNMKHPAIHDFHELCDTFVRPGIAKFVKSQSSIDIKSSKGFRYSNSVKQFALKIHFLGPTVYRLIKTSFNLPSIRTLQNLETTSVLLFVASTCSGYDLQSIIFNCIHKLSNISFNVKVMISDLGFNFKKFADQQGIISETTYFSVSEKEIVYMYDPPHLLKATRNNFFNYRFECYNKIAEKVYLEGLFVCI